MKEFIYSLKCLTQKKEFYFALIGILLVNLIHVFLVIHYNLNTLVETGYRAEYLHILYNSSVNLNMIIIIVFPILCSMILSDLNFIEKKEKSNIFLYTRLNQKKIIFSRFIIIIIIVFLINFLSFLLNYISLYFIYGSGNARTFFQNTAFCLTNLDFLFMDSLRISNVPLFLICVIGHISLLLSLLSGLAYAISFFVKQKIVIYVFPFLIMLLTEFVSPFLKLNSYSIVKQLQPLSVFKIDNSIVLYCALLLASIILLTFNCKKKDLL